MTLMQTIGVLMMVLPFVAVFIGLWRELGRDFLYLCAIPAILVLWFTAASWFLQVRP